MKDWILRLLVATLYVFPVALAQDVTSKSAPTATSLPNGNGDLLRAGDSPELREILGYFSQLSAFPRLSKKEGQATRFIAEFARSHGLEPREDSLGNVVVVVPATSGVSSTAPKIALQSHLDLVAAVDKPKTTGDLAAYYSHGVDLVRDETDHLHSKDFQTSIGGDDGMGVALMMRYMSDRKIPHPELTLLFTVDEEAGMSGARKLEVPAGLKGVISLDSGLGPRTLVNGCLGSERVSAAYHSLASTVVPSSYRKISLTLSGLQGGHSGEKIDLGLANAAKLAAGYLRELRGSIPGALVSAVEAGNSVPPIFNAIPKSFHLELAVPPGDEAKVRALTDRYLEQVRREYARAEGTTAGKDSRIQLSLESSAVPPGQQALRKKDLDALVDLGLKLRNGVLEKHPGYAHDLDLTANFAFFSVGGKDGDFVARLGVMPRAFTNAHISDYVAEAKRQMNAVPLSKEILDNGLADAWTPEPSSWLIDQVKAAAGEPVKLESILGGVEIPIFQKSRPGLDAVVIGPVMDDLHTPRESVDVSTIDRTVNVLDRTLLQMAQGSPPAAPAAGDIGASGATSAAPTHSADH